jgi:hypothetical protein
MVQNALDEVAGNVWQAPPRAGLFNDHRLVTLQLADVLERFGVLGGAEDFVELFLERGRLAQRPGAYTRSHSSST